MALNDFQCDACGTIEERRETVAEIDAGTPQLCACGEKMHRLPPLVSGSGGFCGAFRSFYSDTFGCQITSRMQLQSLRKQHGLVPVGHRREKFDRKAYEASLPEKMARSAS